MWRDDCIKEIDLKNITLYIATPTDFIRLKRKEYPINHDSVNGDTDVDDTDIDQEVGVKTNTTPTKFNKTEKQTAKPSEYEPILSEQQQLQNNDAIKRKSILIETMKIMNKRMVLLNPKFIAKQENEGE